MERKGDGPALRVAHGSDLRVHPFEHVRFVVGGLNDVELSAVLIAMWCNDLYNTIQGVVFGTAGKDLGFQRG